MNDYLVPEIFDSLKTFVMEDPITEPWSSAYTKELHPRYGIPRPDVSERNKMRRGSKWPDDKVHYNSGRVHTEETRDKHRNRVRKSHSTETKTKMSESAKQREADPAMKAKRKAAAKSVSVVVDGVTYSSKKDACDALCLHRYQLEKLL